MWGFMCHVYKKWYIIILCASLLALPAKIYFIRYNRDLKQDTTTAFILVRTGKLDFVPTNTERPQHKNYNRRGHHDTTNKRLHKESTYRPPLEQLPYLNQIEKDLKPFSNNITLDMIQKAYELDFTVRVQYINQTLYSYPVQDKAIVRYRSSVFVQLIKDTVRRYKTPDFDMVINLNDDPRACGRHIGVSIFSFQKIETCRDILLPCAVKMIGTERFDDELNYLSEIAKNYSWAKKLNKIIWRGSGTGGAWDNSNLDTKVRYRIFVECEKEELTNVCDIGLLQKIQTKPGVTIDNPKIIYRDKIPFHEWMKYKYELVLDGNGSPCGRIDRQLAHNSLLLMQETEYFQMYTKYIKPHVHYVPLKKNVSDLVSAYQWASKNEEKVLQIIQSANDFTQFLKRGSILYYTHVLLTNYSRSLSFKPQIETGNNVTVLSDLD